MHSVNLVIINTWWFLFGWNRLLGFFEEKRKNILRSIYMVWSTLCVS
jgi:hypothetical protein